MPKDRRPPGCPQEVYDAIDVFTDEEIDSFFAAFSDETGEFIGIRFIGPNGKACKFADPIKFAALDTLEKVYRSQYHDMMAEAWEAAVKSVEERIQGIIDASPN